LEFDIAQQEELDRENSLNENSLNEKQPDEPIPETVGRLAACGRASPFRSSSSPGERGAAFRLARWND